MDSLENLGFVVTNSTNFEWYATFNKTVERIISACNEHVFADNLH